MPDRSLEASSDTLCHIVARCITTSAAPVERVTRTVEIAALFSMGTQLRTLPTTGVLAQQRKLHVAIGIKSQAPSFIASTPRSIVPYAKHDRGYVDASLPKFFENLNAIQLGQLYIDKSQ